MWLIDTHTLALKRFQDDRKAVGRYAILSHRWQREEVLFDDLSRGRNVEVPPATRLKVGFAKLENACVRAREGGHRYLWADTACINKESSAELSEAIASMWRWYSDAAVCYAYLCDIECGHLTGTEREHISDKVLLQMLRPSVWFRRGWTLQELIAPSDVVFFDKTWRRIGVKTEMSKILETITGIGENALLNRNMVNGYCVAKRMAWAAKRETTRVEDEAYCLLGIFNVSIPMMYGEGQKAFLRLQEEIVRSSTDQSIFAWRPSPASAAQHFGALFAPDSRCFRGLRLQKRVLHDFSDDSFELTRWALHISMPVHVEGDYLLAVLNCKTRRLRNRDEAVVLRLIKKERQHHHLASKEISRIICEIERPFSYPSRVSRSALEPLEWMDLTILRDGLTSGVSIEFRLEQKVESMIIGSEPPLLGEAGNIIALNNHAGRPFSGGYITLGSLPRHGQLSSISVYLSFGQCLRQTHSFATFRMHWSTTPITEHQLFLQHPTTIASAWLSDTLLTAQATLLTESDLQVQKPRWMVRISVHEYGNLLRKESLLLNVKPQGKLAKELSKLKKEYRRGLKRVEQADRGSSEAARPGSQRDEVENQKVS